MKKVLALALALVMMFAVCVPAFALELVGNKENAWTATDGTAVIKTVDENGNPIVDPSDMERFTVQIPAETTIKWGTTSTQVTDFKVLESRLAYGNVLKVEVTGSGEMALKDHPEVKLAYTLTGPDAANVIFVGPRPSFKDMTVDTLYVDILEENWNDATVGEYTDTLTFTAYKTVA